MMSFCRITGHARNLPKPCYFPLLPPISPADAKKLCRITGRVTDVHHYSPIVSFGKLFIFDGLEGCRITKHESRHFYRPTFIKNKDNEKSFDAFFDVMLNMKTKTKKVVENGKKFVYHIEEQSRSIVFPPELEEAIRTGEIESLSISKDGGHLTVKIKQGRTVKIQLEPFPKEELTDAEATFYYGEGQNKETLEKQQSVLNERNIRKKQTMDRRKLFEKKEQMAEDDERKDSERPMFMKPRVKFDPIKKKQKEEKMKKIMQENQENKAIILPESTDSDEQVWYEKMLDDIFKAHKFSVNVTTCISKDFDWAALSNAENAGFDWNSFPSEEEIIPIDIDPIEDIIEGNDSQNLDIAAAVKIISPMLEVDEQLLRALSEIKDENLKTTENVSAKFKRLNSDIPTLEEINDIIANDGLFEHGYLVERQNGKVEFVKRDQYTPGKDIAISGVMIKIKNKEKFVCGQIIYLADQESFVAGQTIETPNGKRFVPGQTIIAKDGHIQFIPGQCVSNEVGEKSFIAGKTLDAKFVPGQMVDRGDCKPVFMSGQTVMTVDGPKFVPGEINISEDGTHEFVPGIKLPTIEGDIFVPGQAFQSNTGLNFTPGQIIDTTEGPSFVPGHIFKSSDGQKKFVKGDLVKSEDGKVKFEKRYDIPMIIEDLVDDEIIIPNEELQLVSIQGEGIVGFAVIPSNTANVRTGEKLYGDIVETEKSVLFYISGKLPEDIASDAKVISGQLAVGKDSQRFIPGKMMTISTGEKFIPGQMVQTNHGEEFVPGQIVESADGPKFVPGQLVATTEGEKFIPGQVIMEEEGPKFVPGQIIHTKNGATFIPGQVMNTEDGQKFVPGQLVETIDGPRFVPGQVIETTEGPKFISGSVIETEDGLKYVPHHQTSSADESEEDSEISFQGFDVSPEELQLLSDNLPENIRARTPITRQQSLIDSDTLKKLAVDTMEIHGRTPEPSVEKKKKRKKKGRVVIDALEEDNEDDEGDIIDNGTEKVEILNHLIRAATSFSTVRKDKELQKVAAILGEGDYSSHHSAEVEALKFMILNENADKYFFNEFIGQDEQLISDILTRIGIADSIETNDQAKKIVSDALREVVTSKCDKQISSLILKISEDPENLFTDPHAQILLTEAVGIVCVTGDVEVASLLEKFISEPSNPNCLKEDKDVLAVLRQLLVLHRIAERNPEISQMLQELQINPEGVKDRNKVRKLIKKAKLYLQKEKTSNKLFDVRHVASSKDIPSEVFQQLREDKDEALKFIDKLPDELFRAIITDQRCGDKFIQSLRASNAGKSTKELEKFKKGMAIVITKENMEAVIPRNFARSVCYGIIPYILIDEEGFKFFERGLTGRKLAPSRIIENTWYQPDSIYDKTVLLPKRVTTPGMKYQMVFLGGSKRAPTMQYTSLVPSSGPTRIFYSGSQRKLSTDNSAANLRRSSRSSTPGIKYPNSALHDYYPGPSEVYPRRSSLTSSPYSYTRAVSPHKTTKDIVDPYAIVSVSNYIPQVPYSVNEVIDSAPIAKSGTVGRLLNKYSNFSLAKEFGYRNPSGAYNKYSSKRESPIESETVEEEEADSFTDNDRTYLPSRFLHRTSSTPDKSAIPKQKGNVIEESKNFGYKPYQRQFSDIYESEEKTTPQPKLLTQPLFNKNNLLDKMSYNKYLNSDSDDESKPSILPRPYSPKIYNYDSTYAKEDSLAPTSSYVSRLKDWKNKQDSPTLIKDDEEVSETVPRRYAHNRYETALTGEEDSSLYGTGGSKISPYSLTLRKRYGVSYEDDDLDKDDVEPYQYKNSSSYSQKYGDIDDQDVDYERKHEGRVSRFLPKSSIADKNEMVNSKPNRYKGSKTISYNLDDTSKKSSIDELEMPSLLNNSKRNSNRPSYSSHLESDSDDEVEEDYSRRQPYGYTAASYEAPSTNYSGGVQWGMLSKRNDPYSARSSYINPVSTYGGYATGIYNNGPMMYGQPTRKPYGASAYGGGLSQRRYTTSYDDLDDDDDDDDNHYGSNCSSSNDQRRLASKIAKKYAVPTSSDE